MICASYFIFAIEPDRQSSVHERSHGIVFDAQQNGLNDGVAIISM